MQGSSLSLTSLRALAEDNVQRQAAVIRTLVAEGGRVSGPVPSPPLGSDG